MKKIKTILVMMGSFLMMAIQLIAQAPEGIPYQAVARNTSGNLLQNQNVSLRFSIHDGTAGGTVVYKETHAATTNNLGLFNVIIGQGTILTGTFSGINWGSGAKFTQVEFDVTGGTAYIDMGTTQMMSVPYALYSGSSNTSNYTGGTGIDITGNTISNTAPDQPVTLTGSGATTVTGTYPNFNVTSTDNNTTYNAGTGIDVTGTTITNTAPDQPVTLTGNGATTVTGTYPNFTISSTNAAETDPEVSSSLNNKVPKWNGSTLTDGNITDNGVNVGIGTASPNPNAALDISSTTGGLLVPRMTQPQRDALTPIPGMIIHNTTSNTVQAYTIANSPPNTVLAQTTLNTTTCGTSTAQSFIAPTSAALYSISVYYSSGSINGTCILRNGAGTSGSVLASQPISFFTGPSSEYEIVFLFQPSLTAGSIYTFEITGTSGCGSLAWGINSGNPYPLGALYSNGSIASCCDLYFKIKMSFPSLGWNSVGVGSQGPMGSIGPTGATGAAGPQGPQGPQGPAGVNNISGTVNRLIKFTGASSGGNSIIYDNGGAVGIGTTTPSFTLDVSGTMHSSSVLATFVDVSSEVTSNIVSTNTLQVASGAGAGKVMQSDANGNASWVNPTSLPITESDPQVSSVMSNQIPKWNGAVLTDGIVTDNGINVGIGTTTPSQKLDINGTTKTTNLQVTSGAGAGKVLQSDANGNASWVNATSLPITESDPKVSSSASNQIPKWNGTILTDGIVTDNGTNIGIGTTTPSQKLDVNGTTKTTALQVAGNTSTANLQVTSGAGTGKVLQSDASGNGTWINSTSLAITEADPQVSSSVSNQIPKWNGTSLVDGLIKDDGAAIGIGTATPRGYFDVAGSGDIWLSNNGTNSGAQSIYLPGHIFIAPYNGTNVSYLQARRSDNTGTTSLRLRTYNSGTITEAMHIEGNGNVGIGTITPLSKLDVEGGITVGATYSGAAVAPPNGAIIEGNVGIGTSTVHAQLQFANTSTNRKIVLSESTNNDHQFYGIGTNTNVMRYQVPATTADHVFYAGVSTGTSSELMRIKGTGEVNIPDLGGTTNRTLYADASGNIFASKSILTSSQWITMTRTAGSTVTAIPASGSLSVSVGDIVVVEANIMLRLTAGSGTDDFSIYASISGTASATYSNGFTAPTSLQYRPSEDANDHDNVKPVSYLEYFTVTSPGTLSISLTIGNSGDDTWEQSRGVMVIRKM